MAKAAVEAFVHDDLMLRYAHLRKRKSRLPLTQEHRDAVCDIIRHQFLLPKQACRYIGISEQTLKRATDGDEPKNPEWAEELELSRFEAQRYWMARGQWYADAGNNPGQKYAEFMLKSLNRERFGDKRSDGSGGPGLNVIIMGGGEALQIPEVLLASNQPALTEG